jgi:hypothetical protein
MELLTLEVKQGSSSAKHGKYNQHEDSEQWGRGCSDAHISFLQEVGTKVICQRMSK